MTKPSLTASSRTDVSAESEAAFVSEMSSGLSCLRDACMRQATALATRSDDGAALWGSIEGEASMAVEAGLKIAEKKRSSDFVRFRSALADAELARCCDSCWSEVLVFEKFSRNVFLLLRAAAL